MKRILYLLDKYPSFTETFIDTELKWMSSKYPFISVFALRKENKKNKHDNTIQFYYPEWLNINTHFKTILYISKSLFERELRLLFQYRTFKLIFNKYKLIFIYKNLEEHIIRDQIYHVHAHFASYPTDLALYISKQLDVTYSFSAHAQDIYTQSPSTLYQKIESAKFIITCTKYNKNYLDSLYKGPNQSCKVQSMYHGINWKQWICKSPRKRINAKQLKILTIARLVEKKGLNDLVTAIELLHIKGIQATCTIIGEGPLKKTIQKSIKDKGLQHFVSIKNFLAPSLIKKEYLSHDIFVLPAKVATNGDRDGIPNVLLEALAMRIPTISTDISGIPELISHKQTGLIIPQNSPHEIVQQVVELISSPKLVEKIRAKGLLHVIDKFDLEDCCEELLTCFKNELKLKV